MSSSDYLVGGLILILFYVITWIGVLEYNAQEHVALGVTLEKQKASEGFAKEVIVFILGTVSGYVTKSNILKSTKDK